MANSNDNNPQKNQNQLNIELTDEVAEGTYANLAIISHSNSEFVMDFVRIVPNVPKAKVKSRIIMTPFHAKRLAKALMENVNRFEQQHGKIDDNDHGSIPPMNFNIPKAQA